MLNDGLTSGPIPSLESSVGHECPEDHEQADQRCFHSAERMERSDVDDPDRDNCMLQASSDGLIYPANMSQVWSCGAGQKS